MSDISRLGLSSLASRTAAAAPQASAVPVQQAAPKGVAAGPSLAVMSSDINKVMAELTTPQTPQQAMASLLGGGEPLPPSPNQGRIDDQADRQAELQRQAAEMEAEAEKHKAEMEQQMQQQADQWKNYANRV